MGQPTTDTEEPHENTATHLNGKLLKRSSKKAAANNKRLIDLIARRKACEDKLRRLVKIIC